MLWYAIDSSAMKIWDYVCHVERSQNKPQQWVPVVKNCESSVPCLTFFECQIECHSVDFECYLIMFNAFLTL